MHKRAAVRCWGTAQITMSIQEIERAIAQLTRTERDALIARLAQQVSEEHVPPLSEKAERRRALAEAARPHWAGGDGLDFQRRIRAEWDDRASREA